jgi:glycolate oxidase iron-sulfur subunit
MQTRFTAAQLENPDLRAADAILRRCVHCGFCNAACPTFALHGDELEGPRGRIWLIREMLESGEVQSREVVRHLDSCLSCLACKSACPSGVDYGHLADIGRAHVEKNYRRPAGERFLRAALATILPRPALARLVFGLGRAALPARRWLPASLRALVSHLEGTRSGAAPAHGHHPARGPLRGRVALLAGCVQDALAPEINAAAVRVLTRAGFEVTVIRDACCGAVEQHLGFARAALRRTRRNVRSWREQGIVEADAILATASGCGTMLKDYRFLLRESPESADAQVLSERVRDISEFLMEQAPPREDIGAGRRVAMHVPCSLRHGQRRAEAPLQLLEQAGFEVREAPEDHLCCGSAGTHNLLHRETAAQLGERKAAHIAASGADIVASANLGCMLQLGRYLELPVLHVVQLLDDGEVRKKDTAPRALGVAGGN